MVLGGVDGVDDGVGDGVGDDAGVTCVREKSSPDPLCST